MLPILERWRYFIDDRENRDKVEIYRCSKQVAVAMKRAPKIFSVVMVIVPPPVYTTLVFISRRKMRKGK